MKCGRPTCRSHALKGETLCGPHLEEQKTAMRSKKRRQRLRKKDATLQAQREAGGPDCAYCGAKTVLVPDSTVYQRSYGGWVWRCGPCDAFVGCHMGTFIAKGRVSNKALRTLKVEAHALFDRLWVAAVKLRGWSKHHARQSAYRWLAGKMGIPYEECHIGMFDEHKTRLAIDICKTQMENKESQ